MKRILGRVLTVIGAVVMTPALVPACTENDQTIYVRHVMAPQGGDREPDRQGQHHPPADHGEHANQRLLHGASVPSA